MKSLRRTSCVAAIIALLLAFWSDISTADAIRELGTITGVVRDSEGNPIENVVVRLDPYGLVAVTGQDGMYTFRMLPAGEYDVTATMIVNNQDKSITATQTRRSITVNEGSSEPVTVHFLFDYESYPTGIVAVVSAKDAGEVLLTLEGDNGIEYTYRVYRNYGDRDQVHHVFSWATEPGKYLLTVTSRGYERHVSYHCLVSIPKGGIVNMDIPLDSEEAELASIQGMLRTIDGGLAARSVTVEPLSSPNMEKWSVNFPDSYLPSSKQYKIYGLKPGQYLVRVTVDARLVQGFGQYTLWSLAELTEGESKQVNFDPIPLPGVISMKLVDGSGRLLGDVYDVTGEITYEILPGVERTERIRIHRLGPEQWITLLAEGRYKLHIENNGYRVVRDIVVESGKLLDLGPLTIGPEPPEPPESSPVPPGVPSPPGDGGQGDGAGSGKGDKEEVYDPERIKKLVGVGSADTYVNLGTTLGQGVAFTPEVAGILRATGKVGIRLEFGEGSLDIPVSGIDLDALTEVNPGLKPVRDASAIVIRYKVRKKYLPDPGPGLELRGPAYEVVAEIAGDGSVGSIRRFPTPATLILPGRSTMSDNDSDNLALWMVREHENLAPVPSWITPGGKLMASLMRTGTYVPAVRRAAFQDTTGHWAEREIGIAYSHGIVNGLDAAATRFAPGENVTRAEFAAMLARTLGLEPDAGTAAAQFRDVPRGAWYAGVVGAAWKAGIVKGTMDRTFTPGAAITRLELAVMVGRALKAQGHQLNEPADQVLAGFRDLGDVGMWAREDVALAVQAGVVKGVTPDALAPGRTATRAEAAVMLVRYLEYVFQDPDGP